MWCGPAETCSTGLNEVATRLGPLHELVVTGGIGVVTGIPQALKINHFMISGEKIHNLDNKKHISKLVGYCLFNNSCLLQQQPNGKGWFLGGKALACIAGAGIDDLSRD